MKWHPWHSAMLVSWSISPKGLAAVCLLHACGILLLGARDMVFLLSRCAELGDLAHPFGWVCVSECVGQALYALGRLRLSSSLIAH